MSPTIEVIISPQGETTIQTLGYSGNACQAASKFLEDALGVTVNERKTAEFYGQQQAEQHAQQ